MNEVNKSGVRSTEVAEDHLLRSEVMRQLIAAAPPSQRAADVSSPPRLLVQFWDNTDSIPSDVQDCLDTWSALEGDGFDRLLFDDISAGRFIAKHLTSRHKLAFEQCHHPAMRSDYFRYCFILIVGGFYVDADDVYVGGPAEALVNDGSLKLQPLCYDIEASSMCDAYRSAIGGTDERLIFYANNTPLVAPPGNPIIASALDRATSNLLSPACNSRDVQTLTGPGNLTASLVQYALDRENSCSPIEFELITEWDSIAVSKWPLAYRSDRRNWRLWQRGDE
jgi:hypothetical protein